MDYYRDLAGNYDLVYNDTLDVEFYLNEAKNARGKVLEMACGTGRILLRLIKAGIDARGVDLSKEMLDALHEKARRENLDANAIQGNMTDFSIDMRFRLLIVPYRSFLHLRNQDKEKALGNFYRHLDEGGRLIIHSYNPTDREKAMDEFQQIDHEEFDDYTIDWYLKYEKGCGHYRIELSKEEKHVYEMDLFFISPRDMEEMLRKQGFRNIRKYSDFHYSPYSGGSEVIFVADR